MQTEGLILWRWLPGTAGLIEGMLRACPARLNLLFQAPDRFPGPRGPGHLSLGSSVLSGRVRAQQIETELLLKHH